MTPLDDGMARVTAVLRGIDAVALMHSLRTRAESLRAAGEKTSASALEADLLVEDVLRGPQSAQGEPGEARTPRRPRPRPGLDVGIVITDTALLGREDDAETAQLEGYGTLPAHIVRTTLLGQPPGSLRDREEDHPDEVVSAFYRRLYTHPRTGDLVGMESRSRAFPAGLARMLRWRDTTCRTPWCNATIRHHDHVIPHHRGGPTSFANGQGLCIRCNLLKELGLWILAPLTGTEPARDIGTTGTTDAEPTTRAASRPPVPPDPGTPPRAWSWTSPHGATGISPTPPLITPGPDPTSVTGEDPDAPDPPASAPPP